MHKSNYRPTRSQQLYLASLVKRMFLDDVIVVHHVLEDTPCRLVVQIERRYTHAHQKFITFERIEL